MKDLDIIKNLKQLKSHNHDGVYLKTTDTADCQSNLYRQAIINSNFDVWQRGLTFMNPDARTRFTADRFVCFRKNWGTGMIVSRQPAWVAGSRYCLRLQRTIGVYSTAEMLLHYEIPLETAMLFAGKAVTFSCRVRPGNNFSAAGKILNAHIYTGVCDREYSLSLTDYPGLIDYSKIEELNDPLGKLVSITTTIPANATQICLCLEYTPTGTAGESDYIEVSQMQFNVGSQPLSYMPKSFSQELQECQRYYECCVLWNDDRPFFMIAMPGALQVTNAEFLGTINFKVQKRIIPYVTLYSEDMEKGATTVNDIESTAVSPVRTGANNFSLYLSSTTAIYKKVVFYWTAEAEIQP